MNAKLRKSDINDIIHWTPAELDGRPINEFANEEVGYYMPSNANWIYKVYAISHNSMPVLVVARFGEIIGNRK